MMQQQPKIHSYGLFGGTFLKLCIFFRHAPHAKQSPGYTFLNSPVMMICPAMMLLSMMATAMDLVVPGLEIGSKDVALISVYLQFWHDSSIFNSLSGILHMPSAFINPASVFQICWF